MSPSDEVLLDLHRRMCRIRAFEMRAGELMESNRIPGSVHLYVGQEGVAAGVCVALRDDDQITSTHRGHGHVVAKGGEFEPMVAELFGRATGLCGGKGGSMHISDPSIGMLGANGIVGAGPPIAVGAAFANRYEDTDRVAVTFFGDGATNEGTIHEAGNMAMLWSLPCIFVCENNEYSQFTPRSNHQIIPDIASIADAWGMPSVIVDGMDAVAVYEVAAAAVARARAGEGPTFIEAKTYRYYDHVGFQGLRIVYRSEEEIAERRKSDPIEALEASLDSAGLLSKAAAEALYKQFDDEVLRAIEIAEQAPTPSLDALMKDVYSSPVVAR